MSDPRYFPICKIICRNLCCMWPCGFHRVCELCPNNSGQRSMSLAPMGWPRPCWRRERRPWRKWWSWAKTRTHRRHRPEFHVWRTAEREGWWSPKSPRTSQRSPERELQPRMELARLGFFWGECCLMLKNGKSFSKRIGGTTIPGTPCIQYNVDL